MLRAYVLTLAGVLALAYCAGCVPGWQFARQPEVVAAPVEAAQPVERPTCPVALEGTEVYAAETDDGIAMAFVSTDDQIDELRLRVAALAAKHNRMHAIAFDPGAAAADKVGVAIASRARVERLQGGAQLVLMPEDSLSLDALRRYVNRRVALMQQSGTCPPDDLAP